MNLIVAIDKKRGIGLNNSIPWYFKEDLQFFKKITLNSIVIMGRNTWESLKKPLPQRYNIVLSTTKKEKNGEHYLAKSLDTGEKINYKIVGKDEADLKQKLIFFQSPIGKGLIGKNKSDLVEISTPSGTKNFEIKDVKYI